VAAPPPEGFAFRTELRVRYAETDAQTVVYHANYFAFRGGRSRPPSIQQS